MENLTAVHFAHDYLLNPTNPLSVYVIGTGGTGSHLLTALARMDHSLKELGHPGIHVTAFDPDIVSPANRGRQLFAQAEEGHSKAVVLIHRINRFFGTDWKAVPKEFGSNRTGSIDCPEANIYISCVDSVQARYDLAEILQNLTSVKYRYTRDKAMYWMDMGNSRDTGQVILSTVDKVDQPESKLYRTVSTLPMITDEFSDLLKDGERDDTPSCSLAEALLKQDLFVNSTLAQMGASLLWNLFRQGFTAYRGFFLNLRDFRSMPIEMP